MKSGKNYCLTVLLLLLLFPGCGKKPDVKEEAFYANHQLISLAEFEREGVQLQNYRCIPTEKYVYVTGSWSPDDSEEDTVTALYRISYKTGEPEYVASYPGEYLLSWCAGAEDTIAIVCAKTESESCRYLLHMLDGETKKEEVYPLDGALAPLGEYGSFSAMSVTEKELVAADSIAGAIVVIDYHTGTQIQAVPTELNIEYLGHRKDGTVFCIASEGDGTLYALRPSGGALEKKAEQIFVQTGRGNSFLLEEDVLWIGTDTALFSYCVNEGKAEKLFPYVNYDILPQRGIWIFHSPGEEGGGQWKLVTHNQTAGQVEVCHLSTVAFSGAAAEKEVITLTNYWLYDSLQEAVVAFNKYSDKYRVEVITAPDTMDYEEYHDNQTVQFLAGEGPDIFSASSRTNYMDFMKKGILEDLLPYMQADLEEKEYFANALYAYENQGKVYAVSPNMEIYLLVGREEVIGKRKGWTFAELCEVMEANPQIKAFMPDMDPLSVLQYCYFYGGVEPTDFAALRQCLLFAEKYGQGLFDGEKPVLGENVLLMEMYLHKPEDLQDFIKHYGNDLAFVGYPREDRQGIRQGGIAWSINANSRHKEGAWAFILFLLEREYQYAVREGFPILIEAYEKKLAESVPDAESEYIAEDVRSKIRELTDESCAFQKDMDYEAWDIVSDEAQSYFAGIKTLDEVMEIIQGRLAIYESEKE